MMQTNLTHLNANKVAQMVREKLDSIKMHMTAQKSRPDEPQPLHYIPS